MNSNRIIKDSLRLHSKFAKVSILCTKFNMPWRKRALSYYIYYLNKKFCKTLKIQGLILLLLKGKTGNKMLFFSVNI